MLFLTTALALALHTLFWGAGLALLVVPRPWDRYWPVFVPVCGLTLQATAVWLGIHSSLPGTQSYAAVSELIPLGLLAWGGWRRGARIAGELWRFRALGALMVAVMVATVWPFAVSSHELTTSSMGSCDAADYAAGARTLREFSRNDRSGFLGLTEVVRLESVDNFFDHWIRLNHFAPSALIAHHAAIFNKRSFELISVFTAGVLVLSLPIVFWLARASLHHRPRTAFFITLLYGLSPLMLYAVYHVAIGQLLAGQAIALLTWGGCAAARLPLTGRARVGLGGLLLVGYALVLASYHFMVVVCLAPVVAYAVGRALWRRQASGLVGWTVLMGLPLVVASMIYLERVLGLKERFVLFRRIDFGWHIPLLTPEGWLGIVAGNSLAAHATVVRVALSLGLVGLWVWMLWRNPQGQRPWRLLTLCMVAPILAGYTYLQWRGAALGTNASYDAYKLLAVFYPGLLAALAMWLRALGGPGWRWTQLSLYAVCVLVVTGNLYADASMWRRMCAPILIVNQPLRELRQLESRPEIESINVLTGDPWSRLWANAMLLRKRHYFAHTTYEGRHATALRGRYDLVGRVCRPEMKGALGIGDPRNPFFTLLDTRAEGFIRVEGLEGWHDLERNYSSSRRHRWTQGNATVFVDNPSKQPIRVRAQLTASAVDVRDMEITLGNQVLLRAQVDAESRTWDFGEFELAPGRNTLVIHSNRPSVVVPGKDRRHRAFRIEDMKIAPVGAVPPSS